MHSLVADRRRRPVSRHHHGVVGQREEPGPNRTNERVLIESAEVRAANAPPEERVAGEHDGASRFGDDE